MAASEQSLIPVGRKELFARSFRSGSVVKSVRLEGECDFIHVDSDGDPVMGSDGKPVQRHFKGSIRCTQPTKWTKMGLDEKTELEAEFTDPDEFNRLFKVSQKFEIDVAVLLERKGLVQRLQKALGTDADVLKNVVSVQPTEAFLTEAMTKTPMTKRWDRLKAEGLCLLQKPSFGR